MLLNQQKPQKVMLVDYGALAVHSIFKTIQGEGPFAGRPAVFLRLWGCNLQCPYCDTDYTSKRLWLKRLEVVTQIEQLAAPSTLVVITGGEPFRQRLRPVIEVLSEKGYPVQIETNGTLFEELPWEAVTVVCSPKTGLINERLLPHISALKYVLHADSISCTDGLPLRALDHPNSGELARPPKGFSGTIYLQPIDDKTEEGFARHSKAAIDSCLKFGYTLGLQMHKFLNLE